MHIRLYGNTVYAVHIDAGGISAAELTVAFGAGNGTLLQTPVRLL